MVTLTQTLLSLFGCRVVLPQSGILMNNGINWFDPRPGGPNGLAPDRRGLSNYVPDHHDGRQTPRSPSAAAAGGASFRPSSSFSPWRPITASISIPPSTSRAWMFPAASP